ncbi:MAG: type II toxin-antitoxin system RelE/ParE family toxin [Candidatus Kapabacteria bacterium]|jgi:mRNA interferase RelE/StbE|nr:type II toxin-antitoxin system RelE/ParE family toxin [Candidatus Kapabacteria bacterium]
MKSLERREITEQYSIIIKKTPQKFLENLNDKDYFKIDEKILSLKNNPFQKGVKKLFVYDCLRIRVGNYRILYNVNTKKFEITILDIDNRKDVYKKK